jgi:hypothetical protein
MGGNYIMSCARPLTLGFQFLGFKGTQSDILIFIPFRRVRACARTAHLLLLSLILVPRARVPAYLSLDYQSSQLFRRTLALPLVLAKPYSAHFAPVYRLSVSS